MTSSLSDRLQHHYSQVRGLGQEDHGSHRTGRRLMEEQGQKKKHEKCYNLQSSVLCTVYYSSHLHESAQGHHALFCMCLENSVLTRKYIVTTRVMWGELSVLSTHCLYPTWPYGLNRKWTCMHSFSHCWLFV